MRMLLLSLLFATLGNADIVKLVKAGLSAETIETKISASETDFDTSTDALVALAGEGVPDRVIRAMIEHDAPAVLPTPPAPPAPAVDDLPLSPPGHVGQRTVLRMTSRRYDVTVHADQGGKCEAELRIDGKGIKASQCRRLDFELAWGDVESVCYTYGFRGEVVLKTHDRERRVSTTTPAEARRLVEHIRMGAPKAAIAECR
jgi:hypothetical protein